MAGRRLTPAEAPAAGPPAPPAPPSSWASRTPASFLVVAVMLAVVITAGIGIGQAVAPNPTGTFAGCHTAAQLAPGAFGGLAKNCINVKNGYQAIITTSRGQMTMVLNAAAAPVTVNNFVVLAVNGFYDGQAFWRVQDWVLQTGDPQGDGRGGPGYVLPEEPNADSWKAGSVGMARAQDGPINGSQFFILKQDWPGGDPKQVYNHFGIVVIGLDLAANLTTSDRILHIEVKSIKPTASPSPKPSASP